MPLGFGVLAFGMPINGSLGAIVAVTLTGSLAFGAFGLLLATRARTFEAVSGLMNMAMLPMWLLSGVFFSSSNSPARCSRSSRRCRSRRWSMHFAPWCSRARTSRRSHASSWSSPAGRSFRSRWLSVCFAGADRQHPIFDNYAGWRAWPDHRRAITPGDVVSDDAATASSACESGLSCGRGLCTAGP